MHGRVIKPEFISCDSEGNTYVSDQITNRILKIDTFTGEVLSILLLEGEEKRIESMRWSNEDHLSKLTLLQDNQISTYVIADSQL